MHSASFVAIVTILVAFVLPFVAGSLLAKALKLKDYSTRFGMILFAITLSLAPFLYQELRGGTWQDAIRLGIDLAGGTNLVFEVDKKGAEELGKKIDAHTMDQLVGAIRRRLDPANQEQITVRRVGADRIEVIIPKADREVVENKKAIMRRLGSLEFALLANERDHADIIREARLVDKDLRRGGRVVASWRQIAPGQELGTGQDIALREVKRGGKDVKEVLVIFDREDRRITGDHLIHASEESDQNGAPGVGFELNAKGGGLFAALTSQNRPLTDGFQRRLAILLDGQVYSAPTINSTINTHGIISGRFTSKEREDLIQVLNAGALDVPIKPDPVSEFTVSPTLGHDVQRKGVQAIVIAALGVFAFMAVYYLFAGMVADFSLMLNLLMTVGAMAFIKATFTLPGLAGLVLTIGMAVDANVLIYERMREELERGSSLRMAIQNGFSRAFSAIVDSNVTSLITAVVMYISGTDQIRGFAVSLFIGLVTSMFSALYFGRVVFEVFERKRWIKSLRMLSWMGVHNFDFISKRHIAYASSATLIIVGLAALVVRGQDNLDIDFRGGTMVSFTVVKPAHVDVDKVRELLQGKIDQNISLEELSVDDDTAQHEGTRLRLRIPKKSGQPDPSAPQVRSLINTAFAGTDYALRYITMKFGEIKPIPGEPAAAKSAAAKNADTPESKQPIGVEKDRFAGGHEVDISFSSEVLEATIADYIAAAVAPGDPRDAAGNLFEIKGSKGSGLSAKEGSVRRYSEVMVRVLPEVSVERLKAGLESIQKTMESEPVLDEINTFAAEVALEMQTDALISIVASIMAIVAYVWFRFDGVNFGVAAVIALVHDTLAVIGMVALGAYASHTAIGKALMLSDFKFNMTMIAALLTIIGYSLNDTIVIFDRIREIPGKNPDLTKDMVNASVNQTLSRTMLTALNAFIVMIVLYIFGGEGIHGFAYALVIGLIVGTYSTIYVANPFLLWMMGGTGGTGTKANQRARVPVGAKT